LQDVRFEVFSAVTMKSAIVWEVTSCGSCRNQRFEELIASIIRVKRISELGTTLSVISNWSTQRTLFLKLKDVFNTSWIFRFHLGGDFVTGRTDVSLWKIWVFHGGEYEECRLLGCYAVWIVRTDVSAESSASIIKVTRIGELGNLTVTSNRRKQEPHGVISQMMEFFRCQVINKVSAPSCYKILAIQTKVF
jgi:hypothetical protein